MIIKKDENEIIGQWFFDGKNVAEDDTCKRIKWLSENYLKKIANDRSGWSILYKDSTDNRFWELTYLQSEMHGGGPPRLVNISFDSAQDKYFK